MTHRLTHRLPFRQPLRQHVAPDQPGFTSHILNRWRLLAERRLNYLTELSKSGRWRRYYTEASLMADIRDAEKAVSAWCLLDPMHVSHAADTASEPLPSPPFALAQAS